MKILKWKIERFFSRLSRSCRWFVYMWENYEWDYGYLVEVMRKKMIEMYLFYKNGKLYTLDSPKSRKQIRQAILALRKWQNNEAELYGSEELEKRWGRIIFKKAYHNGKKYTTLERSKVLTEEDKKRCRKETRKFYKQGMKIRNKYKDEFFNSLKENIENWWD